MSGVWRNLAAVEIVHHDVEVGDSLAALEEKLFDFVGHFVAIEIVGRGSF